jgi:hypothetical protein
MTDVAEKMLPDPISDDITGENESKKERIKKERKKK